MDDSKLKFLPRHLQRPQPASSHKSKRRVTVEEEDSGKESDRRKPSVFERLGPGASQRQSDKSSPCVEFQKRGTCPFGKSCPYSHAVSYKGQSKRDDKDESDDLRLKFKGKDPNKMKSQVVIRKPDTMADSMDDSEDSDNWSIDKLAREKEMDLEKKRQEILSALKAEEQAEEKKSSSESESSPERPVVKKKKEKAGKKEKKKRHKKTSLEKEAIVEKSKESKRKHDSDDEEAPHKKKKKKKHRHSDEGFDRPAPVEEPVAKVRSKEMQQVKRLNTGTDAYDPASPTSVTRESSDESDSPTKTKGKGSKMKKKKKDKGHQVEAAVSSGTKSKKLLSPLKKVLKTQKKTVGSVFSSSKKSRSASRSRQRSRSSERSSSSGSSSSPSPVRKKKPPAADVSKERMSGSKRSSRSMDKRGGDQQQRGRRKAPQRSESSSSSSSSSSSASSSASRDGRRKRQRLSNDGKSRGGGRGVQKAPMTRRADGQLERKKRETSTDSRNRGRDERGTNLLKRRLPESGRMAGNKMGGRKDGGNLRGVGSSTQQGGRNERESNQRDMSKERGSIRRDGGTREAKGRGNTFEDRDRGEMSSRRGGGERDEKKEGRDSRAATRGGRDELSRDRRDEPSRDRGGRESRDRGGREDQSRDRGGGGGSENSGSQRGRVDKRSVEREEERMRRPPGGGLGQQGGRRSGGGGGNQFPSNSRMGQFQGGDTGNASSNNMGNDRGNYDRGPGRFNRGSDNGDGRGWDDRRSERGGGVMGFGREEWESGRAEGRGGGFDGYRGGNEGREFGGGRGREERRPGGSGGVGDRESSKEPPRLLGPKRGEGGGGNYRGEEFGRGRDSVRDWKQREGSHDSSSRRDGRDSDAGSARRSDNSEETRSKSGGMSRMKENRPEPPPPLLSMPLHRTKDKTSSPSSVSSKQPRKTSKDRTSSSPSSSSKQPNRTAKDKTSPSSRDESLASLFSEQTTPTAAVATSSSGTTATRKRPNKSFGGKKSPKKPGDDVKAEKSKTSGGMASLLVARSRLILKKKPTVSSSSASASGSKPSSSSIKTDAKKETQKTDRDKEKPSKGRSPESHRTDESRKARKSSKSPDPKRSTAGGTNRSPASKRSSHSRSPAPSSGRDRKRDDSRSPAPGSAGSRDRRKQDVPSAKVEEKQTNSEPKKRERVTSHSASEADSYHSSPIKKGRSSDNESLPAKLDGGDIVAAMLDDGQQEERVFSDWSDDDDADNILNGGDSRGGHLRGMAEDLDNFEWDNEPEINQRPPRRLPFSSLNSASNHPFNNNNYNNGPPPNRVMEAPIRKQPLLELKIEPLLEKPVLEKNIPNVKILEDVQKEKPVKERRRRNTENEGYEEISSDENDLDEEGDKLNKRTIVGILDIDLASLMPLVKPKMAPAEPVFQRYKAANVFAQLGVSRALAGEKLFQKVQEQLENITSKRSEDDEKESCVKNAAASEKDFKQSVHPEPKSSTDKDTASATTTTTVVKQEPAEEKQSPLDSEPAKTSSLDVKEESKIDLLEGGKTPRDESYLPHGTKETKDSKVKQENGEGEEKVKGVKGPNELHSDSPSVHQLLKARARERCQLFNTSSILTRALTARKDLDLRRRLCRIPHRYDQSAVYPSGVIDPDLYNQCMQLFKQNRPLGLPKPQLTTTCST